MDQTIQRTQIYSIMMKVKLSAGMLKAKKEKNLTYREAQPLS